MSLDKFRIKPPRRDIEGEDLGENEIDKMEEVEPMENEEETPETYKAKYTCSNCGAANEDDVPWAIASMKRCSIALTVVARPSGRELHGALFFGRMPASFLLSVTQ